MYYFIKCHPPILAINAKHDKHLVRTTLSLCRVHNNAFVRRFIHSSKVSWAIVWRCRYLVGLGQDVHNSLTQLHYEQSVQSLRLCLSRPLCLFLRLSMSVWSSLVIIVTLVRTNVHMLAHTYCTIRLKNISWGECSLLSFSGSCVHRNCLARSIYALQILKDNRNINEE